MISAMTRQMILGGVMLLMLGIAALWSHQSMADRRAAAQTAADDLQRCRQLAQSIHSHQGAATMADDEDSGVRRLGERLRSATQYAQISADALQGITPLAARRMGESPYLQKPTSVSLRRVTLQELVAFFLHVTEEGGLSVRDLRLQSPRDPEARQYWDATVTISYLIYAPPAKPKVTSR